MDPTYNWFKIGLLHQEKGDFDKAMANYGKILRVHSAFVPAIYNYGICLEEKGDWEQALKQFTKAVKFSPGEKSIRRHLIFLYKKLGREDEAQVEKRQLQIL